ncbi:MAG: hypothetical protein JXP73_03315 [Deltaproteobacteria bacterium]|nr:hypothetical protein [Deltaproteobacteria bacterium]
MARKAFVLHMIAVAGLAATCGRQPLSLPAGSGGQAGARGSGGAGGGGAGGGGNVVIRLPDGGLSALIGDGGILGGILDAPRDSLLGQLICGPEVRLLAPCSDGTPPCLLPSAGGVCACTNGTYLCPFNTTEGPQPCPQNVATGSPCVSPLSVCIGGGANACVCLGTYTCF